MSITKLARLFLILGAVPLSAESALQAQQNQAVKDDNVCKRCANVYVYDEGTGLFSYYHYFPYNGIATMDETVPKACSAGGAGPNSCHTDWYASSCDAHSNCGEFAEGEQAALVRAVEKADWKLVRRIAVKHPASIYVASERHAIQIRNCKKMVIASIALPPSIRIGAGTRTVARWLDAIGM